MFIGFNTVYVKGQEEDTVVEEEAALSAQMEEGYFTPFLQANGDGLARMISFDWGLHFFRNRGQSNESNQLALNGLPMNSAIDGSIPWKELAGLNEQWRSSRLLRMEDLQENGRWGMSETQQLDWSPFTQRLQNKVILSAASRFYRFRAGITTNQEMAKGKQRYTLSLTSRIGGEKAPMNSISYLAGWAYKPQENRETGLFILGVATRKGKTSPQTKEVYDLGGSDYNPNGGNWLGRFRPSRSEEFHHPLLHLFHRRESRIGRFQISLALQGGQRKQSFLAYREAPNPNPVYYKYLPSYYRNKALGNRLDLLEIESFFGTSPEVDWEQLINVNRASKGVSHYSILENIQQKSRVMANADAWFNGNSFKSYVGLTAQSENRRYYRTPLDLLGGKYWKDTDPFTDLVYNTSAEELKKEGDAIHHSYRLKTNLLQISAHLTKRSTSWVIQSGAGATLQSGYRKGDFQNQLYPQSSIGQSRQINTLGFSIFTLARWNIHPRQQLLLAVRWKKGAIPLDRLFVEPEFSNTLLSDQFLSPQMGISLEAKRRQAHWEGRMNFFYNQVGGVLNRRTSYLETAHGEGILTEVVNNQLISSLGVEGYLKWKLNSEINIDLGWQFRRDFWMNRPSLLWYERPGLAAGKIFSEQGPFEVGGLSLNHLRPGKGPEKALGLRLNYRSPDYWWIQSGIHWLWDNWVQPALNRHSEEFLKTTSLEKGNYSEETMFFLRRQEQLPSVGYLHLAGGKSWKIGSTYLSLFLSLQNVLATQVPTGGFQQNRVAHADLALEELNSGFPLFSNKYWMGSGRTFFLNLSGSF